MRRHRALPAAILLRPPAARQRRVRRHAPLAASHGEWVAGVGMRRGLDRLFECWSGRHGHLPEERDAAARAPSFASVVRSGLSKRASTVRGHSETGWHEGTKLLHGGSSVRSSSAWEMVAAARRARAGGAERSKSVVPINGSGGRRRREGATVGSRASVRGGREARSHSHLGQHLRVDQEVDGAARLASASLLVVRCDRPALDVSHQRRAPF